MIGLPQEYWRPNILFEISGGIGVPISLDDATVNWSFGHYARVLVDLNLAGRMHDQILVEREGFAFFVGIEIERMPLFCSHCTVIGHSVDQCKFTKKNVAHSNQEPPTNQVAILGRRGAMKYVPKQKEVVVDLDANHEDPGAVQNSHRKSSRRHPSRSPT